MNNTIKEKKIFEIEFLRTISILLVILFHFDLLNFNGGFVGVDVFFVISGYLITSIILKEKSFSFLNFYLKRLRRLLPIILLVTSLSLIISLFLFSPVHFIRLIDSSLSAIFGLSNFFFWSEYGYFDFNKNFKPLLHTWSLSVELQFYLMWPMLIFFLKKYNRKTIISVLLILLLLSLISSFLYSGRSSSFFYFPGFRIYEFSLGGIIYFYNNNLSQKYCNILFCLGIFLIFYSALSFDGSYSYPGIYALFPCLGAAAIILSKNKNEYINYIKNNFITRYISKISYTIYMIHWPILIFFSYQKMDNLIFLEKVILIIVIFFISSLAFKFVEQPFRYNNKNKINFNILLLIFFLLISIITLFLKFYVKSEDNYLLKRSYYKNISINQVYLGRDKKNKIEDSIFKRNINYNNDIKKLNTVKKILVLGDSHAFDFFLALETIKEYKKEYHFNYKVFDYLYCFKIKNYKDELLNHIKYKILKRKNSCAIALNYANFDMLVNIDKLIIANRWKKNIDIENLIKFFKKFNKEIIIIGNGQRFYDVPTLFFKKDKKINLYAKNLNTKLPSENNEIKEIALSEKSKFFDKSSLNCDPKCIVFNNNTILYSDKDHWAYHGLEYFGNKIMINNFNKLLN